MSDGVRYDELSIDEADRITAALAPYLTENRRARIDAALSTRTRDVVLVLEDISSDHNASAVLRTAEAFGLLEVHVVPRAAPFKLSRRVSIGSHKWLDIRRHPHARAAYGDLIRRGFEIWASDIHGQAVALEEVPVDRRVALVFGNEHEGLTPEASAAAHGRFRVPMLGLVESLNISVAAAISSYDQLSRRRQRGELAGLPVDELRRLRAVWYTLSVRSARTVLDRAGLAVPSLSGSVLDPIRAEIPPSGE